MPTQCQSDNNSSLYFRTGELKTSGNLLFFQKKGFEKKMNHVIVNIVGGAILTNFVKIANINISNMPIFFVEKM